MLSLGLYNILIWNFSFCIRFCERRSIWTFIILSGRPPPLIGSVQNIFRENFKESCDPDEYHKKLINKFSNKSPTHKFLQIIGHPRSSAHTVAPRWSPRVTHAVSYLHRLRDTSRRRAGRARIYNEDRYSNDAARRPAPCQGTRRKAETEHERKWFAKPRAEAARPAVPPIHRAYSAAAAAAAAVICTAAPLSALDRCDNPRSLAAQVRSPVYRESFPIQGVESSGKIEAKFVGKKRKKKK